MAFDRVNRLLHPNSCFLATSFNLGPLAEAKDHRDDKNLIAGICAIVVLGKFNYRISGHLILREPKLILEVKPGDIVVIPSAAITHCNSPLQPGEERMSIVQYTAGAIFRYNAQGGVTQKDMDPEELAELKRTGPQRFKQTWELFPSFQDFQKAKEDGIMPSRNMKEEIESGKSFLLKPGKS